MRSIVIFILVLATALASASESVFVRAQQAASEGRYEEVVALLSDAIDSSALTGNQVAIAYSNRGIAYSLLDRHALAVQDLQRAIAIYPDHPLSLNHLGVLAEHVEADFDSAAIWYERAAALGYSASQVNLGNLYRTGRGVPKDYGRAMTLFEEAASNGYEAALVSVGEMFLQGQGVAVDYERARELLLAGVEAGVVKGHYSLGQLYEHGWGVTRDVGKAFTHYRTSAIAGHAPSQGALGYLYRRGRGVSQDYVEAARWYEFAAEQGDNLATNRLAWLLATCPVPEVCDGEAAFDYAVALIERDPSTTNLDTLAAASARLGDFDRAIDIINQLLSLAQSDASREKFRQRLERYRNGVPFQL